MTAFSRFRDWATNFPGSTRSIALIRICLPLVAWVEFGEAVQPHRISAPLVSYFFYLASFLSLIGYRAPYATFAAGVSYMLLVVYVPSQMTHPTYLLAVATMLLALTPCGVSLSVDRFLASKRGTRSPEEGNLWALRLIGLQVSAVLFWGAYSKITSGFPSGDRVEQMLVYFYSGLPVATPGWAKAALMLLSGGIVVVELGASVLLWIPKYRMKALAACVVVTVLFQAILAIRGFGFVMCVLYLAFVPPETVHRVIDELLGRSPDARAIRRKAEEEA